MNTKFRLVALLFLAAGISFGVNGQVVSKVNDNKKTDKGFSIPFNARAGITYANQKENLDYLPGDSERDSDSLLGFYVGVSGEMALGPKFMAIAGLDFSQKGSQFDTGSGTVKRRFSYLDLPLRLQYSLTERWHFSGGVQPSLLLGAKRISDDRTDDIADQYKSFDLGVIAGVRYDINTDFGIQLQYDYGLLNIFENTSFESVRNCVWRLGLNYRIGAW